MNDSHPPEKASSNREREKQAQYSQLALFSIIVAEMTVVPASLAGVAYYFTKSMLWTGVGAVVGLGVGFYRIYLLKNGK